MFREQRSKIITYFSSLILILGFASSSVISPEPAWLDLFLGLTGVVMSIFACGWLQKKVLLLSLFFYLLDFNYSILFNPLTSSIISKPHC